MNRENEFRHHIDAHSPFIGKFFEKHLSSQGLRPGKHCEYFIFWNRAAKFYYANDIPDRFR